LWFVSIIIVLNSFIMSYIWNLWFVFNKVISLEDFFFFFLVFVVKFYLQATVVTKIPLVALDKSHAILVTNNKGYWMKKGQQIQILWLHYICIVTCDQNATIWSLLKANDVLPCVLIFHYLKLLLLFWNNLGCLILFNSV
jgi:hypothetical protein